MVFYVEPDGVVVRSASKGNKKAKEYRFVSLVENQKNSYKRAEQNNQ